MIHRTMRNSNAARGIGFNYKKQGIKKASFLIVSKETEKM